MKIFKKITAVLIAAVMVLALFPVSVIPIRAQAAEDGSLKLWYDEPASQGTNILSAGMNYSDADGSNLWQQQTLPIGNGDMGANVYGESGQLKEWYEETTLDSMNSQGTDAAGHRHLSHMLGLFPGDLVQRNPEWIAAAKVSMDYRTDNSTGWGMGQRINTWARLDEGNKALELIGNLFRRHLSQPVGFPCSLPDRRQLRHDLRRRRDADAEQHGLHQPAARPAR